MPTKKKPVTLQKLKDLYKDPKVGLSSKTAFISKLQERNIKYNENDLHDLFLDETIQLYKPQPKNFQRRRVFTNGIDHLWNMDLIFNPYPKENDNVSVFLTVIDTFSKYAWVKAVSSTKSSVITEAIKDILKTSGRKPQNVQTDRGVEFRSHTQKYFDQQGINHYFSNDPITKVSIIERFNRTLKQRINRFQNLHGTRRFIDNLDKIVDGYNNSKHRSIKMTPKQASNPVNEEVVYFNLFGNEYLQGCKNPKFKVGDYVRITTLKGVFEKETTHNWTQEKFIVDKVQNTDPCTYILKDLKGEQLQGSFYTVELQLTRKPDENVYKVKVLRKRTVRKQKQVLVEYEDGSTEWIKEDQLTTL